ncbi:MAG: DUF3291 domain-containing protein [Bacteroidota bacterium]
MHLAQANIGILHYPMDHPNTAEFADNLDSINALAEASPGFVWRMKEENGNNTGMKVSDNPLEILNISVWKDVVSLKHFAYKTEHVNFVRKRHKWFVPYPGPYFAMWWIPVGHLPTTEEALERLKILATEGEGVKAFTFRKVYEADQLFS